MALANNVAQTGICVQIYKSHTYLHIEKINKKQK
jgi:hypothetical protein